MKRVCPNCSCEIQEGSRFCPSCGALLDASGSAPTETSVESAAPTAASPLRGGGDVATSHSSLDRVRFVPGAVLDKRYRIVGLLGRGGMGEVYRADDLKLGQPVALKFLPEGLERDEQRLERFLNEVRTARQVTHPNVCRVFDIAQVQSAASASSGRAASGQGQHYLSMEYVGGEDLSSLLRRIGRLPKDKATQIARQLCAGVQAAHEQGILHRDLKPANVMIDGRGQVKITDFGLADLEQAIQEGEIRSGTPAYMAPEQLAGQEVTVKSDVYALGLVLYELFTGKQAFEAGSPTELVWLQQESAPTSPSSHVEGFDPAVERVILRCLEKEPRDRPASALAVSAALPGGDPLAAALAAGETPSPEMVAQAGPTNAMHPALALGLAVIAVVGFAAAQYMGVRFDIPLRLEKPPAALTADAREIIRELGYTEPLYADPVDSAAGFEQRSAMVIWIANNDDSPDRWDRLANPRLGALRFWYRQRPSPLTPRPEPGTPRFHETTVEISNPPADNPGEIVVELDLDGRLTSFAARPRRFSSVTSDGRMATAPAWSRPFALAGLDLSAFEPVQPRYDAFVSADVRAAWVGSLPEVGSGKVRIEAAATDDRVVLFTILEEPETRRLAREPECRSGAPFLWLTFPAVHLVFLVLGVFIARRNLRLGRADRRGARRVSVFVFVAQCLSLVLASHRFWSRDMWFLWAPIAVTGIFWAGSFWIFYVALEPHARRVWPSILTSWSRLVSRTRVPMRDPQVGVALLAGLVGGCAIALAVPFALGLIPGVIDGTTARPGLPLLSIALGERYVLSEVFDRAGFAVTMSIGAATALVVGRSLFRSRLGGMLLVGAIIILLDFAPGLTSGETVAITAALFAWAVIHVTLLVRFGVLALAVGVFANNMSVRAATVSWTEWHGQPALIALVVVALLAAYGFWAATAGRSLFGDSLAEGGPGV